jgi:hypothetical protein
VILIEGRRRWVIEFGNITVIKMQNDASVQLVNIKADCVTDSKVFSCVPEFTVQIQINST